MIGCNEFKASVWPDEERKNFGKSTTNPLSRFRRRLSAKGWTDRARQKREKAEARRKEKRKK